MMELCFQFKYFTRQFQFTLLALTSAMAGVVHAAIMIRLSILGWLAVLLVLVLFGNDDRILQLSDRKPEVQSESLDLRLQSFVLRTQILHFLGESTNLDFGHGARFFHGALHLADLSLIVFQLVSGAIGFVTLARRSSVDGKLELLDGLLHFHYLRVTLSCGHSILVDVCFGADSLSLISVTKCRERLFVVSG
ncbi:hypothetical protein AC579_7630 [Pseudocercospora musae]|uniref:Uncharacterized protein n=1 Tax=Pseudocercospora musae TaxID=113226 RepID=A0A139ICA6_9PEZI|nr:hypothetical protein AC579_7630 [Pseudocercospora musae]